VTVIKVKKFWKTALIGAGAVSNASFLVTLMVATVTLYCSPDRHATFDRPLYPLHQHTVYVPAAPNVTPFHSEVSFVPPSRCPLGKP
jgi:hypothetical protein